MPDHRLRTLAVCIALFWSALSCSPHKPPPPATTQPVVTPQVIPGIDNFAWATPHLCRGGQPDAVGFSQLKTAGVKTIVDLRGLSHRDNVEALGFKYAQIPSSVSNPQRHQIVEFLRLVRDPQNQPIFVHDEAGADRVGLYLAAYRIVEQGWTVQDASVEMANFHFNRYWTQIPAFLNHLNAESIRKELSSAPASMPSTRKSVR